MTSRNLARARPVFLVGAPRSGTTYAQSLVGSHPEILTFPETHFVSETYGDLYRRLFPFDEDLKWIRLKTDLRLNLLVSTKRPHLLMSQMLEALGAPPCQNPFLPRRMFIPRAITDWANVLDSITLSENKSIWLEKTPGHVAYIDEIAKIRPDAKFLHIIREPTACVASMYDASVKYTEWDRFKNIEDCLSVWNRAVQYSCRFRDCPNNLIFYYEDLLINPSNILKEIFSFIGVEPLEMRHINSVRLKTASKIFTKDEPWKNNILHSTASMHDKSYILSNTEIDYIKKYALSKPASSIKIN